MEIENLCQWVQGYLSLSLPSFSNVPDLIWKSSIYLEFLLYRAISMGLFEFFFIIAIHFDYHCFFEDVYFWLLCLKSGVHKCEDLCLGILFYFFFVYYYFVYLFVYCYNFVAQLESGMVRPLRVIVVIQNCFSYTTRFLRFHEKLKTMLLSSGKNWVEILMRIALSL